VPSIKAVDEYEMCEAKLNVDWTTVERCRLLGCCSSAQSYAIFIWTRQGPVTGLYVVKGLFS